jgi:capsular exopolysaccharide synthesis family protein
MDLRAYLDILRRRGWIILVTALLAGALALGISYKQTKIWQATVKISAVPARPDWGLGQQAKDLLRNFVNNINTHDNASQAIATAQLDMNPEDFLSRLSVSAEPENFLIRIDARDQDPEIAKTMAKTMADIFVDDRVTYYNTQDKSNRIEVKLVDSVVEASVYRPKPAANAAAGLVLGALIGALIVLGLEWMASDILTTPEAVERQLELPILGTTPAISRAAARGRGTSSTAHQPVQGDKGSNMTGELITLREPTSAAAEAYRRLRTNLASARGAEGRPLQVLLVASAGADGDKAGIVANLAVAFARVGKRTILVDCDLRHPAQHTLFGLTNTSGVTTALHNPQTPLPLQPTEVPCLNVLTSGPAVEVPADAVASSQMSELLAALRREADIVLIDAAPVVLATDAAELAGQVDGVLLTVSAGRTKRDEAQRAKEMLGRVGATVVGAALVNVAGDAQLKKYLAG